MSKYLVWQVECARCGELTSWGEDESSIPEKCPDCGANGDWWDNDAEED